jgi:diadenosine tetraphosphatase ApaH/serine/threonine PP2A family protein phosphatase
MHGGLSPDLQSMEQIRRVMRPTDVPDTGAFPNPQVFFLMGADDLHQPRGCVFFFVLFFWK